MNPILDFCAFGKLARLSRDCTITEKLDGTNAQIAIQHISEWTSGELIPDGATTIGEFVLRAGSRNRWLAPADDNYGFCKWVRDNAAELCKLGSGRHFGEWWGLGIQRNYGLAEKRFSLFNTAKWSDPLLRPVCCHVVPVLETCEFDTARIGGVLAHLKSCGSVAAPGFAKPEGIVIYHSASGQLFKKTCENDEHYKSQILSHMNATPPSKL